MSMSGRDPRAYLSFNHHRRHRHLPFLTPACEGECLLLLLLLRRRRLCRRIFSSSSSIDFAF